MILEARFFLCSDLDLIYCFEFFDISMDRPDLVTCLVNSIGSVMISIVNCLGFDLKFIMLIFASDNCRLPFIVFLMKFVFFNVTDADLCENPHRKDHHPRGGELRHHRQR